MLLLTDYHVVETQTHLKVSKAEAKSVHSDAHSKRGPDGKAQNNPRNGTESRADLHLELGEISLRSYVSSHNLEDLLCLCLYYPLHASEHPLCSVFCFNQSNSWFFFSQAILKPSGSSTKWSPRSSYLWTMCLYFTQFCKLAVDTKIFLCLHSLI